MPYFTALEPAELTELEALFGATPHEHHRLTVHHPFLTGEHQELTQNGRRAEICYVMHRGNVSDGVLLHIKTFYPEGAFRLPTGGIHQGERVLDTLRREVYEETGLTVGEEADHVQVERYLGVTSYAMQHVETGETHHFATYHFLVRMPTEAELDPQDEEEHLGGWQWVTPARLGDVPSFCTMLGYFSGVGRVGQVSSDQSAVCASAIDGLMIGKFAHDCS